MHLERSSKMFEVLDQIKQKDICDNLPTLESFRE
jgi:hypothetical protein